MSKSLTSVVLPEPRRARRLLQVSSRVALGVLGAYLLSSGAALALAVALQRLGMVASEAVLTGALLAFLIYPLAALWAFVAPRLWPVALLLVGGGLGLTLLSPLLLHSRG